jgi:hypothetical protein
MVSAHIKPMSYAGKCTQVKLVARAVNTIEYSGSVGWLLSHRQPEVLFRGQGGGPLHTSSGHIPPPNGPVTRAGNTIKYSGLAGWLLSPYQLEVRGQRWLAAARPVRRIYRSQMVLQRISSGPVLLKYSIIFYFNHELDEFSSLAY